MKPRVTYPRTVVLPKDCELVWNTIKERTPAQSFNGWITDLIRTRYASCQVQRQVILLDNPADEA